VPDESKPRCAQRLDTLVMKPGEKCGLATGPVLDPMDYCVITMFALNTGAGPAFDLTPLLMTEAGVGFSRCWFAGGVGGFGIEGAELELGDPRADHPRRAFLGSLSVAVTFQPFLNSRQWFSRNLGSEITTAEN
jgi:hypothetical protein